MSADSMPIGCIVPRRTRAKSTIRWQVGVGVGIGIISIIPNACLCLCVCVCVCFLGRRRSSKAQQRRAQSVPLCQGRSCALITSARLEANPLPIAGQHRSHGRRSQGGGRSQEW